MFASVKKYGGIGSFSATSYRYITHYRYVTDDPCHWQVFSIYGNDSETFLPKCVRCNSPPSLRQVSCRGSTICLSDDRLRSLGQQCLACIVYVWCWATAYHNAAGSGRMAFAGITNSCFFTPRSESDSLTVNVGCVVKKGISFALRSLCSSSIAFLHMQQICSCCIHVAAAACPCTVPSPKTVGCYVSTTTIYKALTSSCTRCMSRI